MPYNQACILLSGCVGIGTDTPASRLTIAPATNGTDSSIEFNSADNAVISAFYSQTFTVDSSNTQANRTFNFVKGSKGYVGGTLLMTIQADTGRVGIGATSPTGELHICASQPALRLQSTVSGNMQLGQWDTVTNRIQSTGRDFLLTQTDACNILFNTNNTERMRISSTGNIGIGTTAPGVRLHVRNCGITAGAPSTGWPSYNIEDSTTSRVVCIDTAGNGDINTAGFGATVSLILGQYYDSRVVITPAGAGSQVPADQGTGHGRDLMVKGGYSDNTNGRCGGRLWLNGGMGYSGAFNTNVGHIIMQGVGGGGNVGIGTTSPSYKLQSDANAASTCTDSIVAQNSGVSSIGHTTGIRFRFNTAEPAAIRTVLENVGTGTARLGLFVSTDNTGANLTERLSINCNGRVGIATTTPSYLLHVNGTFYAAGSSIKYKEGICNYDTDSCLFMCLKPVTYQYKDEWQHLGRELKSQSQIGLIAEDVAEVMPELAVLVNEEDEKVVRNVDYEKLSVVLLKEVQKLRQEVDELKNNK